MSQSLSTKAAQVQKQPTVKMSFRKATPEHLTDQRAQPAKMPTLRNPKHERFAQEIANGKSISAAYKLAGFKPHRGNASSLGRKQSIAERVAEILRSREQKNAKVTERAIEKAAITKADVIGMLIEDRALARANVQTSAAIRAAELLGKELGMFIDRREQGRPGEFDGLDREELEQHLVDELAAGGVPEKTARAFIRARSPQ
jgi:phage terminase small subunit